MQKLVIVVLLVAMAVAAKAVAFDAIYNRVEASVRVAGYAEPSVQWCDTRTEIHGCGFGSSMACGVQTAGPEILVCLRGRQGVILQ